jgi:hypothetical protein
MPRSAEERVEGAGGLLHPEKELFFTFTGSSQFKS